MAWDQERSNEMVYSGRNNVEQKIERAGSPGIASTPPGHELGYCDDIAHLLLDMDGQIATARAHGGRLPDKEFAAYTQRNIGYGVEAVRLCEIWMGPRMIRLGQY
jgi:hypothetical protein